MPAAFAAALALPEVWIAIAVLLLVWAIIYIFQKPISVVLGSIPAIGGQLADAFAKGIGVVVAWATEWAAHAVRPLVEVIAVPVQWFASILTGITTTAEAIVQAIVDTAHQAASTATYIINRVYALAATVADLAAQVPKLAAKVVDAVGDIARIVAVTIPAAIATAVHRAVVAAGELVDAAVRALERGIDALRSWAVAQVANLARGLDALRAWASAAIAYAVAVAVQPLQWGLGNLGDALKQLQLQVDGRLGQLTAALAGLLALDLVRVVPRIIEEITRMRRECVDPTCSVIGPQLGLLQSLLQGVEITLLLAWVADAVNDPHGTAQQTAGDAGGLASMVNGIIGPDLPVRL
jgi:hypothetical protein